MPPLGGFERRDPLVSYDYNGTDPTMNGTTAEWVSFGDVLSDFGFGFVFVPIVAIMEQVAIAKVFCNAVYNGRIDRLSATDLY